MCNKKMSELFPEAFQVEHNKSFEVQDVIWDSYGIEYVSSGEQDSAIEHAVLNHDRLTEENKQLREMLKVAVDDVDCYGEFTAYNHKKAKELLNK